MTQLPLDQKKIRRAEKIAKEIAEEVHACITPFSTISVERALLRLYGVDGVDSQDTPLPNILVDLCCEKGQLEEGVSRWFAAAMLQSGKNPQDTAGQIIEGHIIPDVTVFSSKQIGKKEGQLASDAVTSLDFTARRKLEKIHRYGLPPRPFKYLIVATGNVYEDRTQAESAVMAGADIIAQIRSTAQSLLDYIPFGPTTEGFGGTYATQANFKIMRDALDQASARHERYIRLVNYSSGLCMAEIAVCGAFEDLDILLNDSMYGILFRDINMQRTFIDQHFSRLICSRAGIIINTGEDNYLTTADAVDQAYTVTASQLINSAMAKKALLPDELIGLGHAFEINPEIENALLFELAHAQLARQLFPHAPLKYMPPTKHKSTDIFYSLAMDTMFNLVSIITSQGIHLAGIPTEAIHTPLMQDRYKALRNINYVFNIAKNLGDEIEFKADGFISRRAQKVLNQTINFLQEIHDSGGLMQAISQRRFAGISRAKEGGKGLDGVFKKGVRYTNPVMSLLMGVCND